MTKDTRKMTIRKAAQVLDVSVPTAYALVKTGKLELVKSGIEGIEAQTVTAASVERVQRDRARDKANAEAPQ